MISVVGDIDAETLGRTLDHVFGALPQHSSLAPIADAKPPLGPTREIIEMDVPQSVAQFGHRAFSRKDDDFIAAYILNYIIGGGGFSSRLMEEVREKRGLAYSVHSNLFPYQHGAVFVGNVATQNEAVGQSLEVIEGELRRLAEEGPSAEELAGAKSYLTGAYALRFESSSSIANQLLWIQIEDLGIDYVDRRNELIDNVSLDDIKRVAKRLIEADRLITTIVGKPVEAKPEARQGAGLGVDPCRCCSRSKAALRQASARPACRRPRSIVISIGFEPRLDSLREAYATGALPLLRVPERRDDIAPAREALAALTKDAQDPGVLRHRRIEPWRPDAGAAWRLGHSRRRRQWRQRDRPRIRFYDNLDARTLERALAGLDLATTRFVVISKSGNTPETLVQTIAAIEAVRAAGLGEPHPRAVPRPHRAAQRSHQWACATSARLSSIPTLPHDPKIGGRFSGLTNVGLLPALARGLDVEALARGCPLRD